MIAIIAGGVIGAAAAGVIEVTVDLFEGTESQARNGCREEE